MVQVARRGCGAARHRFSRVRRRAGAAVRPPHSGRDPHADAAPPRVALISIDGLRPDALTQDRTPNILALAERGSYAFAAQTVFPSTTLPGHTSMLTGVEPSVHGITFDEYRETFQLTTPTVLSLAHAAGKHTVMVVGKTKLKQLAVAGTLDSFVLTTRGDADVVNEAIVLVPAGFDLLVVHLPQTDQTGHASGWMSAEYLAQVQQTDAAVGRLVSLLPPETTIVVTADHGGQLQGARHAGQGRHDDPVDHRRPEGRASGPAQPAGPHRGHGAHRPQPARHCAPAELRRQARQRSVRAAVAARPPALPLPRGDGDRRPEQAARYTPATHVPSGRVPARALRAHGADRRRRDG